MTDDELDLLARSVDRVTADPSADPRSRLFFTQGLIRELELAEREEEAEARVARLLDEAVEPDVIQATANALAEVGRTDEILTLLERAAALPPRERARALPRSSTLARILGERTAAGDLEGAFAVLDAHADATAELAAEDATGSATEPRQLRTLTFVAHEGRVHVSGGSNGSGFPPPAAPIDDEQVTLLYSQLQWLRTAGFRQGAAGGRRGAGGRLTRRHVRRGADRGGNRAGAGGTSHRPHPTAGRPASRARLAAAGLRAGRGPGRWTRPSRRWSGGWRRSRATRPSGG